MPSDIDEINLILHKAITGKHSMIATLSTNGLRDYFLSTLPQQQLLMKLTYWKQDGREKVISLQVMTIIK